MNCDGNAGKRRQRDGQVRRRRVAHLVRHQRDLATDTVEGLDTISQVLMAPIEVSVTTPRAIIDSPVGPYSDPNDIRAWIDELRTFPDSEDKRQALTDAEQLLARRTDMGPRRESTQCLECKQYQGFHACRAFPGGIPAAIFTGQHDHRQPFDGDNGVRFDPIDGDAD